MNSGTGVPVAQIWSGGQTGIDRAALDVALELGIVHGGWIPTGRLAEDGVVPSKYDRLRETGSADYAVRTSWNVRDTDGTLIISRGPLAGGSLHTRQVANRLGKPLLHIDLADTPRDEAVQRARGWLASFPAPLRLNVAGPRASGWPEGYDLASELLHAILLFDTESRS